MRQRGDAVARKVFKHTLRVRYSECDPQGVVFNANYVAYFDVVITELWREALGRYQDLVESGARTGGQPVVEGHIRHVFIDPEAKTKRSIPDDVRKGLEPYLEAEAA